MSFSDGNIDGIVEPPVFNAFQHSIRQEDRELRDFLTTGTVKSINSISTFDQRMSSIPGNTLRDITANLRNPTNRKSGLWGGSFGRNSDRNVILFFA
jgi:hypothetical protein